MIRFFTFLFALIATSALLVYFNEPPAPRVAAVVVSQADLQRLIDSDQPLPPGDFTLTDTLTLGTPGQLTTKRLRGAGRCPLGVGTGTILRAAFTGRPVIEVIGARDSSIEDLTIIGPHIGQFMPPTGPWTPTSGKPLAWWPEWDRRYDPSSGISVAGGSSGVVVRNVDVIGCAVGLVTYPAGGDGQGEMIGLERCRIAFGTYGVSITHTQNRQLKVLGCDFLCLHTAITNCTHGNQGGYVDGLIQSHFNTVEQIASIQGYAGCTTFANCYGEVVGTLGVFSDGSARTSVGPVFRDCCWRLVRSGLLADGGSLFLEGGSIEAPDFPVIGSSCSIRDTKFRPLWYETQTGPIPQARKIVADLACGPIPRLRPGVWSDRPWRPQTAAWFPSVGQDLQTGYAGEQPARRVWSLEKRFCTFDGTRLTTPPGQPILKAGDIVQDSESLATWFVASVAGRTATLSPLCDVQATTGGSYWFATFVQSPR